MHRNTYVVILFLAAFAALVVGVNVGKRLNQSAPQAPTAASTSTTPTPSKAAPTEKIAILESEACGVSLVYPTTLTLMEGASGSALLMDEKEATRSVAIACQADIPRPPLVPERIETMMIRSTSGTASVSAKLYHNVSPKDGTLLDELIFTQPRTGKDVYVAGYGDVFDAIIKTVKLLP